MNEEPIEITLLVIDVLQQLEIRYLIAGSLASTIYGEPRFTRDADILADVKFEHVQPLFEMLEPEFNISAEAIHSALLHRTSFNVIHYESLFKVDIFVPKNRRFDELELQRRTLRTVGENQPKSAYFATAEDVILAKLDWFRLGDEVSDLQWRDVTGVFKANQGRLDLEYMKRVAGELGVFNLLQRLLGFAAGGT